MPRERFLDSDGVRLHALDWGGAGRAVVLLAGLFRDAGLTRRGHGRSDRPTTGYDLGTLVDDIRRCMDALQVERAILIGHSFAGLEMPRFAVCCPQHVEALLPWIRWRTDVFGRAAPAARVVALDTPYRHLHPACVDETVRAIDAFLAFRMAGEREPPDWRVR